MNNDTATAIVNAALERRKEQNGEGWEGLAKELKVDRETIWRWRKGKLGKATRVLVELVAQSKGCDPRP